MAITIEALTRLPIEKHKIEAVERKGVGHPDSLADGMAEAVSRALSREYIRRYGSILHHNTDKLEIVGGEASVGFGGGQILRPIFVLLSGRATTHVGDTEIPIHEIAITAARSWMYSVLPHLGEGDVQFDSRIGQGAIDLRELYARQSATLIPANDTSFGIGFAPLSETERLVLGIERLLNSPIYKRKRPELGHDIKVMALRENHRITITIAAAFLAKLIPDWESYTECKAAVVDDVTAWLAKHAERDTHVFLNLADIPEKKIGYVTLTGCSAEAGDDGCVGRGNRWCGLITPFREMSLEAVAGKNPVSHVGKLYQIAAHEIAQAIYAETGAENYVMILSQIGRPITDPLAVSVEIEGRYDPKQTEAIVEEGIANIPKIRQRILNDELPIFI